LKGVSYAFIVYNMIKQTNEKWVRESFNSIKNQSDDIIVIDYSSDDNIKEITKEYGFRFIKIAKVKGLSIHGAKMWNKAIYEAKYDIFVMLTPDGIYDENLTKSILKWYKEYDYKKYFLNISFFMQTENNKLIPGSLWVYYKPFLLKVRGLDERTYMRGGLERGTHRYSLRIMYDIFDLKKFDVTANNIHRFHKPRKTGRVTNRHYTIRMILLAYTPKILIILQKTFNILKKNMNIFNKLRQLTHSNVLKTLGEFSNTKLIDEINENFEEGIKKVVNSYW